MGFVCHKVRMLHIAAADTSLCWQEAKYIADANNLRYLYNFYRSNLFDYMSKQINAERIV